MAAHRCQICGDVLFHDDFFSDPSQHVCLTVNGPGMIDPHANGCDIVCTAINHFQENKRLTLNQVKRSTSESAPVKVTRAARPRKEEALKGADSEYLSGHESDASVASH